jgi:flagellar motor switch/type III secretory pathway protein FliN
VSKVSHRLPQVDARFAAAVTHWSCYSGLECQFGERIVRLGVDFHSPRCQKNGWAIQVSLASCSVTVLLCDLPSYFPDLFDELRSCPPDFVGAALIEECAQFARCLEQSLGETVTIDSVQQLSACIPSESVGVTLSVAHGISVSNVNVFGEIPCVIRCMDLLFSKLGYKSAEIKSQVPVRVLFETGTSSLTVAELAEVEVGDILRIERWHSHNGSLRVLVRTAALRENLFTARVQGLQVEVIGRDQMPNTRDEPGNSNSMEPEEIGRLEKIEISLSFSLDERQIMLSELVKIKAGYVFDLQQPVEESVIKIIANGKEIGSGQLVAIGECIGVRVTRFIRNAN